jgi:AraC-like DNA-binding protein
MYIAAPYLAYLIDFAAYRGVTPSVLKRHLANPDIDLSDENQTLPAAEYLGALRQLVEHCQDPLLGVAYGNFLNLGSLGLIHKISLSAHSIEQALKLLTDYLRVGFPLLQIKQVVHNQSLCLQLDTPITEPDLRQAVLDSSYVVIYRELCMMLDAAQVQLGLPYARLEPYEERMKATIALAQRHEMRFEAAQVNQAINQKNMQLLEVLLPQYLHLLVCVPATQSFAAQVRQMTLRLCAPELPNFKQVCAQFAVSERTFQRKLTKEGQSFRAISNDIKRSLATYLREGNRVKTQDIAYILGYSEASAYLHAAKEWFGGN